MGSIKERRRAFQRFEQATRPQRDLSATFQPHSRGVAACWESLHRMSKVGKLSNVLQAAGATSYQVSQLQPEAWAKAARLAQVTEPSEITQQAVVAELMDRERALEIVRKAS